MDREATGSPLTLTAVLVMPRGFDELAASLARLDAQTRCDLIEVVLVHTLERAAEVDLSRFARYRAFTPVGLTRIPTVAAAFIAAAAVARGDVVALVEDHVLLDARWAEATIAAHQGACAAVAPLMANGNPASAVSWANFLASFHEAIGQARSGPVPCGPGHNTSYKRSVLERYRDELEALYQSERAFHYRLQRDGYTIWRAPEAKLAHLNISRGWQAVRHAFFGGALFGRYRASGMAVGERILRTAGAPLVPLVRLSRIIQAARVAADAVPVAAWGILGLLLVGHAAGEAIGYWDLVAQIEARYEFFELHRLECLRESERHLMTDV